ncbi:MAG: single-stranded DNA binding protein [Halobacteriaceae archaeon]
MGVIEEVYEEIDADITEDEFRQAVEEKVEEMGGLADTETAAMLIQHELQNGEIQEVAEIETEMDEVKFIGKLTAIAELREFDRDDEDEPGYVLNATVADETGSTRITFWDQQAMSAREELEVGDVLQVVGTPKNGYNGTEVSVREADVVEDEEIDITIQDSYDIADLSLGLSEINLEAKVLDTQSTRTFDRDDGTTGQVANMIIGDQTGRIRVTCWGEQTSHVDEISPGDSIEISDGYVREREEDLELHLNSRSDVEILSKDVDFDPATEDIDAVSLGDNVDIAGVVRSVDPKHTFDRDDGSEGQVKNMRIQDETDEMRVALWGDKANKQIEPGDEVLITNVDIQEGWQDELEASAGWESSILFIDNTMTSKRDDEQQGSTTGLQSFTDETDQEPTETDANQEPTETDANQEPTETDATAEKVEITGVVVQAGNPVILDNGNETISFESDQSVTLGEEITVQGFKHEDHLEDVEIL